MCTCVKVIALLHVLFVVVYQCSLSVYKPLQLSCGYFFKLAHYLLLDIWLLSVIQNSSLFTPNLILKLLELSNTEVVREK